jgi:L-ascorbate metabolism protein UlaG (beta-lactamase superfamily)
MRLKWFGTATILLEQDGAQLLFDPFISLNDKAFKPSIEELAAVKNICVTHGHLDHIADIPVILKQGDGGATVYCTETPRKTLISKGIDSKRLCVIQPGGVLDFPPFIVRVLKGKHIVFDVWRIFQTLLSPRMIPHRRNLKHMLGENRISSEAGETVVYDISVPGERVLLMGSLNLDDVTEYPVGADLLILPFQGRSDIAKYSMQFVERLRPKRVLLDHFDDTFPPISSQVNTERFIMNMQRDFPDIPVICRPAGAEWIACGDADGVGT